MSSADSSTTPAVATGRGPRIQRVIRQVHLYLGLALVPWVLMYAVSTMVMNHRATLQARWAEAPRYSPERELDYSRSFSSNTPLTTVASLILEDLGLAGAHRISGGTGGRPLIIERQNPLGHHRITWRTDSRRILIERESFQPRTSLERLHRRRGYQHPYLLEDTWAAVVDLTMVGLLFWGFSGVWLWWTLPGARTAGALSLGLGLGLFLLFLLRL